MTQQTHIILISESASLIINFKKMLDVKDKEIALMSIQYPDLRQQTEGRRSKRLAKDSLVVGDSLTVFIHCNQISENTHVNDPFNSNVDSPLQCLDVIQLKSEHKSNVTEIQNPVYHGFITNNLFSLNVELRDFNGELIKFTSGGYVVMKLTLKNKNIG